MAAEALPRQEMTLDESFSCYLEDPSPERLDQVARSAEGFIHHFARLYSPSIPSEDMIQSGYEGLMKAIRGFDPKRGILFSTYAGHMIRGTIRHFIRKEVSYYRPGTLTDLQSQMDALIDDRLQRTGQVPSIAEIAESLNVKEEGVVQVMRAGLVPLEDVELSQVKSIRYESFRLPVEDRILLETSLEKLTDVQRQVIFLLYHKDLTQTEVARELGTHQRKVSRILKKGLDSLSSLMDR